MEAGEKGRGRDRKVMLLSLAFDRFWAGVWTQAIIRPIPALMLAKPSAWHFPLAGNDEADGDNQSSAGRENGLGLQNS